MDYYGFKMFLDLDKYLTIDQNILNIEIHNSQIHQRKRQCPKKLKNNFMSISISKTTNGMYKNIMTFK
jgi:hypothetical protein